MAGLRAMAEWLIGRGFLVVFVIVFLFFSVVTRHFFELENLLNIFSAMAPLAISAAGLALVVMSGRLDISIGSIAFLSCAIGALLMRASGLRRAPIAQERKAIRSEEHTSELQSPDHLVCRLLLEKKKKHN